MNAKLIAPVAIAGMLIVTVALCNVVGFLGLIVPPVVLVALLLSGNPRRLLTVFWVITIIAPTVEMFLPPMLVKIVEQVSGLYLLCILVGSYILAKRKIPGVDRMNVILFALLALTGISGIVNRVPAKPVFFYLLTYMKHFWVFYFAVRYFSPESGRGVFRVMLATFLVQMAANITVYAGINPVPRMLGRSFVDFSVGTVGGAGAVGYYMMTCVIVIVAYMRYEKSVGVRVGSCILLLLSLIQFFFTFTMHAYPLLIGGLGIHYLFASPKIGNKLLKAVSGAMLLSAVLMVLFAIGPFEGLERQVTTLGSWRRQWERVRYGPKREAYEHVFLRASEHVRYPFIGGGPGNYTSRIAFLCRRPLATLPHLFYVYETMDNKARMGGSIIAAPRTGYITTYGELGPLGLLLYWGVYVYALLHIGRQARAGGYEETHRQVLAEAFVPTMVSFLLLNVLTDRAVDPHLNLGLWIWAGCVWNVSPSGKTLIARESEFPEQAADPAVKQ